METYFESFQDDQYTANAFLSVDEDMKDQLDVLESLKEDDFQWKEEFKKPQYLLGKEDFQQIMSDWQQHIKLLQSSDPEDLGLGFDTNLDILNTYPERDFFEDKESPILSKALKCPNKKNINIEQSSKFLVGDLSNEMFSQSLNSSKISSNSSQKVLGLIKTEPNLIRKVTLLNGEKEILGKNIIGLHCLNEIKENPDENCQVTSTVINGKRYKIIIKPKSLKVKKLSEEKIRKTLIKKLFKCNLITRTEPKEDEIISEMRNGNYDVPILESDTNLPSWDLVNLDSDWKSQMEDDFGSAVEHTEAEPVKKVPPLKIKLPKLRKHKKKKSSSKSDEEVDVETVTDKTVSGSNLTNLLENFEDEMSKLQNKNSSNLNIKDDKNKKEKAETSKNNLKAEVVEKIEALKRKKDHRITLIEAMPTKKLTKGCTRMQDAVATMNRNKLLKIVSGGDTVQLDHDYCSSFIVNSFPSKNMKKIACLEEKNPKKDSGMESGDVSDASEGPYTPENSQTTQPLNNFINKKIENCSIDSKDGNNTSAPIEFFQESSSSTLNSNVSTTDLVKTKTASHGNKALTNNITKSIDNSDSDNSVPSENRNISENSTEDKGTIDEINKNEENNSLLNNSQSVQKPRPKRKLKLEEYLSRRNILEKEKLNNFSKDSTSSSSSNNDEMSKNNLNSLKPEKIMESKKTESNLESNKIKENYSKDKIENIKLKEKKYWRGRSRSSSNSSSERKQKRRQSRSKSKSKSCWRSDSNGSSGRREGRGKHKSRRSQSRDRKRRDTWSSSLSRSPSRESSTSSDYCDSKRYKHYSNRYRRRSRSRSVSRLRSVSQSRSYYNRRPRGIYYYNRNLNNRRSKSPYYSYSMREKQRQIEERRVIYVGRIEEGMTNAKLRERFSVFGPIIDISLHFREYGDNYGFVTYAYKADAYDAVEHGNDDPSLPHYDLCFGGRRGFCKEKYADLDGMPTSYSGFNDSHIINNSNESFDWLLREAQAKLKKRKKQ